MDIQRQGVAKRKILRRTLLIGTLLLVAGGVTYGVNHLQAALPSIESGTAYSDTVKRGPMLRQVHGIGSLVPEDILWISAQTDGRIEKIYMQPGTPVAAGALLMEMSNPTLTGAMTGAEFDLKQAEAALADLVVTLENNKVDKQSAAAQVTSDYVQAKIKAERDKQLADLGLIPNLDFRLSEAQARDLETRTRIEDRRMTILDRSSGTQIAAQQVKIDQLKAMYELKKEQVEELRVRSAVAGMLQQLGNGAVGAPPLEVGQNVTAGGILAKVAQQDKLKAQIKITETEAKDIALGQPASIDTHNGVIPGKVIRIDPSAVNGSVLVDVALTGPLPQGARPDLSVDGTVDIERLDNVLYVGRPTVGQPNTTATLFRIGEDGKTATRTTVKLGRASVNTIEIVDGLKVGDKVILSDMSAQDAHEKVRLN